MLRLALVAALALAGCAQVLGLDDPALRDGGADDPDRVDAAVDAMPDAIGPTCDDGACPPGTTCDIIGFERRCRPVGASAAGGPCQDITDCADGLSCYLGVCRTICTSRTDCAPGIEAECNVQTSASDTFLCDSVCDPLPAAASTCGEATYCRPESIDVGSSTVCAARDLAGNLGQDVACGPSSCLPGYACGDYEFSVYRCMALCDRAAPVCPPGTACKSTSYLWDDQFLRIRGKEYGYCKSPYP
jgi:hypothetical protein